MKHECILYEENIRKVEKFEPHNCHSSTTNKIYEDDPRNEISRFFDKNFKTPNGKWVRVCHSKCGVWTRFRTRLLMKLKNGNT